MSIHSCRFIVWGDTLVLTASICMLTFISFETNTDQNQRIVLRPELKIVRMLIAVRAFCFCWAPQGSWDLLNLHHPNFIDENNCNRYCII